MSKLHDGTCRWVTEGNPNALIPWFLMACYAYEILGDPIISDECFDEMAETMNMVFPVLEHMHKPLIKWSEDTSKGSSVQVDWPNFPNRIAHAVAWLSRSENASKTS